MNQPKALASRTPWEGTERSLSIALDIGTTYSAACYCIFDPGVVPEIRSVTMFDGQQQTGNAKIPTVVYYDPDGNMCGAGLKRVFSHLRQNGDDDDDEDDENITKVEWFKVHMRPKALEDQDEEYGVKPLPFGKTVVQVFADFMKYMYGATKSFILEKHVNGESLWESFEDRISFILTHPNGYEPREQNMMREAAVLGGLVPNNDATTRVKLVTEGEASLHYCLDKGLADDILKTGDGVMIVDAGGGTVDLSSYFKKNESFEESAATLCIYQGSVFITRRAEMAIRGRLENTKYAGDIPIILDNFDKTVKHQFDSDGEAYAIPFAGRREVDTKLGVRAGKLRLEGTQIAGFFQPAIDHIKATILKQAEASKEKGVNISAIFLVGGFASSRWLFEKLKDDPELTAGGFDISRPDGPVNKAVANGALVWQLDQRVTTRVSKYTYGIECNYVYNSSDPEHLERQGTTHVDYRGTRRIPKCFDSILVKDKEVSETKEFSKSYMRSSRSKSSLESHETEILCYRGSKTPRWVDEDAAQYTSMCRVRCDLRELCAALQPETNDGGTFYTVYFRVVLLFGLTEFKAQIVWKEDGVEKRSGAVILA